MINKPKTYPILFWNQLQYLSFLISIAGTTGMNMSIENNILSFLISIAGTTGMNMSIENNMLHLLYPCFSDIFLQNLHIAYVIFNPVSELLK